MAAALRHRAPHPLRRPFHTLGGNLAPRAHSRARKSASRGLPTCPSAIFSGASADALPSACASDTPRPAASAPGSALLRAPAGCAVDCAAPSWAPGGLPPSHVSRAAYCAAPRAATHDPRPPLASNSDSAAPPRLLLPRAVSPSRGGRAFQHVCVRAVFVEARLARCDAPRAPCAPPGRPRRPRRA